MICRPLGVVAIYCKGVDRFDEIGTDEDEIGELKNVGQD